MPSRYHSTHRASSMKPMYQTQVVETPGQHRRMSGNNRGKHEAQATAPVESGANDPGGSLSGDELRLQTSNDSRHRLPESSSGNRIVSPPGHVFSSPQRPPFLSTPSGELFPPPRPVPPLRNDGPPMSSEIRATKSMGNLSKYGDAGEEPHCFSGWFKKRKKKELVATSEREFPNARPKTAKEDRTIRPGGGGIVPGTDAPVSAINAGDRRVLLECGKSKMFFPFGPDTTSADLIKSAATCMPEKIDVRSVIMLEYFGTVGIERPIRRYERIRDVMNSWDHDRQNSLILLDPGTGSVETELTRAGVPAQEPSQKTWYMLYSQKPGKWEKRYITLRGNGNGQLVQSKDPDMEPEQMTHVCLLSDFDIYTPTKDKAKKKFKPPKARCFAIKSQQKPALFEEITDYVHLFSTGDQKTADDFHQVVQAWRSWYLVNVMGDGKPSGSRVVSNEQKKVHLVKGSMDSHYQIGSFGSLMGENSFDRVDESSGFAKSSNQFDVNVSPERRTSTVKHQHPPVALNKKPMLAENEPLGNLARKTSVNNRRSSMDQKSPATSDFKDTGLLGRNYSQRRKDNEARDAQQQQPFTGGLLGGDDGMRRQTSVRKPTTSAGEMKRSSSTRDNGRNGGHARGGSIDLPRSGSRREPANPLVDLRPTFREPVQHSRKGKGYKPDTIGAGGLIESATSPEDPLNIPNQTVFRNTSGQHGGQSSSGLVDLTPQHREPIHHSRTGKGYQVGTSTAALVNHATASREPLGIPQSNNFRSINAMPEGRTPSGSAQPTHSRPDDGLTSGGLLGQLEKRQGWGTSTKGRGVIDGSHAGGKTLLNFEGDSEFVKGSLLKQVERAQGGPVPAPVIDREKRHERKIKVGERY